MRKIIRELVGTAGYCLLLAGLYEWLGAGLAMTIGGALMIVAALMIGAKGGA